MHTSRPEWGLGQLLEDESASGFRLFFVNKDLVTLAIFARDKLNVVTGTAAESKHLDNMALPLAGQSKPMIAFPAAKEHFLERYPGGFYGEKFNATERDYKCELAVVAHELLSKEVLLPLIEAESYQQICENAGKLISHRLNNLPASYEKMAFKDGFKKLNDPKLFALSLFEFLHGSVDLEIRFNGFSSVLRKMEADKWPIITNFRFFLFSTKDVFIKPTNLQHAAEVSRFMINYKPELNWLTYLRVMDFYKTLFDRMQELNPRDMIDVQSFIWCIDPNFQ